MKTKNSWSLHITIIYTPCTSKILQTSHKYSYV